MPQPRIEARRTGREIPPPPLWGRIDICGGFPLRSVVFLHAAPFPFFSACKSFYFTLNLATNGILIYLGRDSPPARFEWSWICYDSSSSQTRYLGAQGRYLPM